MDDAHASHEDAAHVDGAAELDEARWARRSGSTVLAQLRAVGEENRRRRARCDEGGEGGGEASAEEEEWDAAGEVAGEIADEEEGDGDDDGYDDEDDDDDGYSHSSEVYGEEFSESADDRWMARYRDEHPRLRLATGAPAAAGDGGAPTQGPSEAGAGAPAFADTLVVHWREP